MTVGKNNQLIIYNLYQIFSKFSITSAMQSYSFMSAYFMQLVFFYTPWKQKKTGGFLFSVGVERDQLHEMG